MQATVTRSLILVVPVAYEASVRATIPLDRTISAFKADTWFFRFTGLLRIEDFFQTGAARK